MNSSIIFLSSAWILYFVLHSALAALPVKYFFIHRVHIPAQAYRLIYVIFSTLGLLAIFLYSVIIQSQHIINVTLASKFIGLLLAGWGVFVMKAGFKSYDLKAFLGLNDLASEDEFKTDGLLKKIRHPVYAGSILLVAGYFIFIPTISNLISAILVILYFLIGIYFEEKKLIRIFGDQYREYRERTPMLIPRLFYRKS